VEENARKKKTEAVIRQMEIDDVAAVYHLGEDLFTSEELPILYRTWDPYEVTDYFSSDPDYCLVAESQGSIVGFVLATTVEKEGTAWKKYGYLSWMGVGEDFQRTRLGRRMYRRLEERMLDDGVRMVIADTEGNNRGAISFFEALGFSVRSEHMWLAKTLRRKAKAPASPGKEPEETPIVERPLRAKARSRKTARRRDGRQSD
jgi:ribosomal protein S18 acetylase RimI-like enzyme